ncbi:MAG: hypothetical protein QNJ46_07210 [Leptolyngbyaceae cyanobacterium MO_188.B28]|nr:hypothetical protein [Leptolyngbyaceae cyanobacterium MO_188.B28]
MTTDPNSKPKDEFYIGYAQKIPPGIRNFLLVLVPGLIALVGILGFWLPSVHNQYSPGALDRTQDFQGVLMAQPVPHLAVPRQGNTREGGAYSRYLLSAFNKAAFDPKALKELSGQWVNLKGLPVYRDHYTLLASAGATAADLPANAPMAPPEGKSLGEFDLSGQIEDSKCYLGVMKPGESATHRNCAIRCISGGVPASLVVQNTAGDRMYFALVGRDGQAINNQILPKVGSPVNVKGEVMQYDDLYVLKANPEEFKL